MMEYGSEMWWVRRPHLITSEMKSVVSKEYLLLVCVTKCKRSTTGNKPVINEKVIFLSTQCLPDISLLLILFVERNIL